MTSPQPAEQVEPGAYIPVTYAPSKRRDADTPVVRLPSGRTVAVRLADCWVDDDDDAINTAAGNYAHRLLRDTDDRIQLHVGMPRDVDRDGLVDLTDILKSLFTFDRIVGRIRIGNVDLSDHLVSEGFATATKPKRRRD